MVFPTIGNIQPIRYKLNDLLCDPFNACGNISYIKLFNIICPIFIFSTLEKPNKFNTNGK